MRASDRGARVRVLHVEDDHEDAMLTRHLLSAADRPVYEVERREDAGGALEALRARAYDALLLDYDLGGGTTGLDVLRAARAEGVTVPAVLVTGRADHALDLAAMRAGVAGFLDKGRLDSVSLERAVRYAVERESRAGSPRSPRSPRASRPSRAVASIERALGGLDESWTFTYVNAAARPAASAHEESHDEPAAPREPSFEGVYRTCREIVERHGGTLVANGTPGAGGTFLLTLPRARQQPS